MLANAAAEGQLDSGRQRQRQFQGKYREIIQGMNQTLEGFATPINDIGEVLQAPGPQGLLASGRHGVPGRSTASSATT